MSRAIHIENLEKRFAGRPPVLAGIDLHIAASEIVALIGPSGCGKSTLVRLISGLERPDLGRIRVGEAPVEQPTRAVGLMFQEPRLLPWLTLWENVAFGLPAASRRSASGRAEIQGFIDAVGLRGHEGVLPKDLSGGMAQRASLARSLASDPQVLALDEPFSAVDALTRTHLQDLLLEVWARRRPTLLVVTHDVDEALLLADRVVVLGGHPARIEETLPVALPRPRDRAEEAFLRERTRLLALLHVTRAAPPHRHRDGRDLAPSAAR